jgi:hypothetical protein
MNRISFPRIASPRKGRVKPPNHHVRVDADLFELPLGLEADDRLVEEDVV